MQQQALHQLSVGGLQILQKALSYLGARPPQQRRSFQSRIPPWTSDAHFSPVSTLANRHRHANYKCQTTGPSYTLKTLLNVRRLILHEVHRYPTFFKQVSPGPPKKTNPHLGYPGNPPQRTSTTDQQPIQDFHPTPNGQPLELYQLEGHWPPTQRFAATHPPAQNSPRLQEPTPALATGWHQVMR